MDGLRSWFHSVGNGCKRSSSARLCGCGESHGRYTAGSAVCWQEKETYKHA
jgi:hypothetical protein